MEIKSARLVYFSPTETTKKIAEGIARGTRAETIGHLDLTPAAMRTNSVHEIDEDFAIIGAPVYGGRVAPEAVNRFARLKGKKIPAAVVVLYGNRAYEDALLELKKIVEAAGFVPIAAGAFIGEHSLSTDGMPIAMKRPDEPDLRKAKEFGRRIREKLGGLPSPNAIQGLKVPGNFPYKERKERPKVSPVSDKKRCTLCGTCKEVCPTGAISVTDAVATDPDGCTFCCACVKNCPAQARVFDAAPIRETRERLFKACHARREPETFL